MAADLEEVYRRLSELYEKQIPEVLSIVEEMRKKKGVRSMPRLENLFRKGGMRGGFRREESEAGPLGVPYGPVRKFLSEWEPMIPERPKLFAQELPLGITREVAIESLAASPWATQWAEGMLRLVGVPPTAPDYERRKKELARKVAERMWA